MCAIIAVRAHFIATDSFIISRGHKTAHSCCDYNYHNNNGTANPSNEFMVFYQCICRRCGVISIALHRDAQKLIEELVVRSLQLLSCGCPFCLASHFNNAHCNLIALYRHFFFELILWTSEIFIHYRKYLWK